jgi:hypothetical protein
VLLGGPAAGDDGFQKNLGFGFNEWDGTHIAIDLDHRNQLSGAFLLVGMQYNIPLIAKADFKNDALKGNASLFQQQLVFFGIPVVNLGV